MTRKKACSIKAILVLLAAVVFIPSKLVCAEQTKTVAMPSQKEQIDDIRNALERDQGSKRLIFLFDNTKSVQDYGKRDGFLREMRRMASDYLKTNDEFLYITFDNNVHYPLSNLLKTEDFTLINQDNKQIIQQNLMVDMSKDWGTNINYAYLVALRKLFDALVKDAAANKTKRGYILIFTDMYRDEVISPPGTADNVKLFKDCQNIGGNCYKEYQKLINRCEQSNNAINVFGIGIAVVRGCRPVKCGEMIDLNGDGKLETFPCTLDCNTLKDEKSCRENNCDWHRNICEPKCDTLKDAKSCEENNCDWHGNICTAECKTFNDVKSCSKNKCYWYENNCNKNPPPIGCEALTDEKSCENCVNNKCYWCKDKNKCAKDTCPPCMYFNVLPCWVVWLAASLCLLALLIVAVLLIKRFFKKTPFDLNCDKQVFPFSLKPGDSVRIGGGGDSDFARFCVEKGLKDQVAFIKKTVKGFQLIPVKETEFEFSVNDVPQEGPCDINFGDLIRIKSRKSALKGMRITISKMDVSYLKED